MTTTDLLARVLVGGVPVVEDGRRAVPVAERLLLAAPALVPVTEAALHTHLAVGRLVLQPHLLCPPGVPQNWKHPFIHVKSLYFFTENSRTRLVRTCQDREHVSVIADIRTKRTFKVMQRRVWTSYFRSLWPNFGISVGRISYLQCYSYA